MTATLTDQNLIDTAATLGHHLDVDVRGPWPEQHNPAPKIYITCSCGWTAGVRRSYLAARQAIAHHTARAAA